MNLQAQAKPAPGRAEPRAPANAYDPEIADMASYIHNYQVKSELAVSQRVYKALQQLIE